VEVKCTPREGKDRLRGKKGGGGNGTLSISSPGGKKNGDSRKRGLRSFLFISGWEGGGGGKKEKISLNTTLII